ncbi:MAG: glycosyltransferase [Rikenellaceae bacterium]
MKQSQKITNRNPRVCLILNIAPLYRKAILTTLDKNDKIDFYFSSGDISYEIDALFDLKQLSGYKSTLRNCYSKRKLVWQRGVFRLLFEKYDAFILTGNTGIRSNWIFTLLAKMMGKKVYLWSHGVYGNESKSTLLKNKTYLKLAKNIFLYGNYAKHKLLGMGFKSENMTVIYNSLDYEFQKSMREKYTNAGFMRNYFGNDYPVILFCGRLTPQKQLNLLIQAVGILKVAGCNVNILFLGGGPCEEELLKYAEEAEIDDRVWFYGECYDEEMIATAFQNSNICVSPGNVGLTAIHSLNYGVPVITHNRFSLQMPEFEAIQKGVNGDFFKYKDAVELSDVIEKWLRITSDNKKKLAIKQSCYKIVDEIYNPENQNRIITQRLLDNLSQ